MPAFGSSNGLLPLNRGPSALRFRSLVRVVVLGGLLVVFVGEQGLSSAAPETLCRTSVDFEYADDTFRYTYRADLFCKSRKDIGRVRLSGSIQRCSGGVCERLSEPKRCRYPTCEIELDIPHPEIEIADYSGTVDLKVTRSRYRSRYSFDATCVGKHGCIRLSEHGEVRDE